MTPEAREKFYDNEIAPVLMTLAGKCQDNGLSMVTKRPATWTTRCFTADASFGIRMADVAAQARGNVDSLIFALMKYGREHGHNSRRRDGRAVVIWTPRRR
jgi:isoleucyl-tRNA synthetase